MSIDAAKITNPFPGLRSFEREQAHLFFGRDEQIRDLVERLQRCRFLPIVGVSGSGKSSLVRAGLIPALTESFVPSEASGWRIAILRPGQNPMRELASALCREFAEREVHSVLRTLRNSSAGLARFAQQRLARDEKLLILVDQFEELFRYRPDSERAFDSDQNAAFVKLLLAGAGVSEQPLPGFEDLPVYVVTTMRSEFLGKCSRFRGLPEALNQSQYLIPRLTREQQRDVIEGPIGMTGASIEPALTRRLLNDLGDNPDQLPRLQHALMRTWEESDSTSGNHKTITVEDYEAVGTMADALNRDADRVYESVAINPETGVIARRLFQRLVQQSPTTGQTRSPASLSELVDVTGASEAELKDLISVFQARGFLTVSWDKNPIVDITHESLIKGWLQLDTWVQEEARSAAIYLRLVDQAALYENKEASLLVNPLLQLTLDWREETKPNRAWAKRYDNRFVLAMQFLELSRREFQDGLERVERQRRSALRRTRLVALVLGALLLLAIGASVVALSLWNRSKAERDRNSRLLYDSNMYSASSAVADGQFTLAEERLRELLNPNVRTMRGFEWFYFWRAVHADEATFSGHTDSVISVAFSPDGKTMATAGADRVIKLWDKTSGKVIGSLSGHTDTVGSVMFSPDGKTLVSGSDDRTIKFWHIGLLKEIATLSGHSGPVYSVVYSPNGKILASASADNTVKLWNVETGAELATLDDHTSSVSDVAFSPDGKTLVSSSTDNTLKLWDTASHRLLATLSGHLGSVLSVAFSPDAKMLASASTDKTVKLWDVATREVLATLSGHTKSVWSVAFSADGTRLASASDDNTVKLWDVTEKTEIATFSGHSLSVLAVAFSPDNKTLASGSADKTVKLWDSTARREVATLRGHSDAVKAVAFSPNSDTLASAGSDGDVRLWNIATRKSLAFRDFGPFASVSALAFSPDGRTLATATEDNSVNLFDVEDRRILDPLTGHSGPVYSVVFSPDGKMLASGGADHRVRLWDVERREEIGTGLAGHSDGVLAVAFSPDGKTLASASADRTIRLWDMKDVKARKVLTILNAHAEAVVSVAFSPDGKTLVSGSSDSTIKFWDSATYQELAAISGHSGSVLALAFSPDGKTLASVSAYGAVNLWDAASHKEVATLIGHSGAVYSVAFSPNGRMLASAGADQTVKIWFAATPEEVELKQILSNQGNPAPLR